MNLKTTLQNINKSKKGYFNIKRINGKLYLTSFVKIYCFSHPLFESFHQVHQETIKIIERFGI